MTLAELRQFRREGALVDALSQDGFALALAAKDARLVSDAAAERGLELPLAELIAERLERGVAAGLGDKDLSAAVSLARGEA